MLLLLGGSSLLWEFRAARRVRDFKSRIRFLLGTMRDGGPRGEGRGVGAGVAFVFFGLVLLTLALSGHADLFGP